MTKSAHDIGCGARDSLKCDCQRGLERKIKVKAKKFVKRKNYGTIVEGLAPDSMIGDFSHWLGRKKQVT